MSIYSFLWASYTCRNLEDEYMHVIIIYCLLSNLPISLDVGLHLCARTLWTVGESEDLKESMQTYSGSRGSVLTADLWPALMTALRLDEFQDWKASICISFYDCSRKAIKRTWLVSNYSKRVINTFLSRYWHSSAVWALPQTPPLKRPRADELFFFFFPPKDTDMHQWGALDTAVVCSLQGWVMHKGVKASQCQLLCLLFWEWYWADLSGFWMFLEW